MPKLILLCGKICSGKTYYAKSLKNKLNAIIYSCDELMFDLKLNNIGNDFDGMVENVKKYLIKKSEEVLCAGINVILDFGFWSKEERVFLNKLFEEKNISYEWHYIDISEVDWVRNISERNELIREGTHKDYFIDEGLQKKCEALFDKPSRDEMDVWVVNKR